MKIPNGRNAAGTGVLSLARIVSEDSQQPVVKDKAPTKSSKDS